MPNRKKQSLVRGMLLSAVIPVCASAQTTQDIRVVTYNTQADVGISNSTILPNLATVIEGIGQEKYTGDSILQLPDIIALQETTSNSTTVSPLVTDLNNYYGSSIFNYSMVQGSQSGGNTDGNGPNALIYNQNTMNLMASVGVGTPEGSVNGEYRQVMRYEFQPVADEGTQNGIFYVYDCHAKSLSSGSESTDQQYQEEEAAIIRNNELSLPSNASVLYVGDWNVNASTDPSMVEMSSSGQGQAFDPLNSTNQSEDWAENNTYKAILTESDSDLRYRDDLELVTSNVLDDAAGSLDYIANSEHAFGNNGSINEGGNIDSNSNTALSDIVGYGNLTPSEVLAAMNPNTGSDHLPVVADYNLIIVSSLTWDNAGGTGNGITWDTTNQNWNNGSSETTYADGSTVTFNDTNNNNYSVTLNTTVSPGPIIVTNSLGNYTISGIGTIAGSGSLTKNGSDGLILSTSNTYSGGTTINAGYIKATVSGALGSGTVNDNTADGLTLGNGVTISNTILVAAGSNEFANVPDTGASATLSGSISTSSTNPYFLGISGSGATLSLTGASNAGGNTAVLTRGNIVFANSGSVTNSAAISIGSYSSASNLNLTLQNSASITGTQINLGGVNSTNDDLNTSVTVSGSGELTASSNGAINLDNSGTANSTTTLTVSGSSVVTTGSFTVTSAAAGTTAALNLNGGTIAASQNSSSFLPSYSALTVNDQTGGAVFNNNGNNITIGASITGSAGDGGFTSNGSGTTSLTGTNTWTGTTNVNAGTLVIGAAGALPTGGKVAIASGASFKVYANTTSGTISGSGTVVVGNGSTPATLQLANNTTGNTMDSLSIANTTGSVLDVTNNHIIINYGTGPDPKSTILSYLASGAQLGAWNGTGIISSTAANLPGQNYGVGFSDGSDNLDVNITSGQIAVGYAQYGDITLQGLVNAADFHILASNFGQVTTLGWEAGDFLYQGVVNAEDFHLLAENFGQTSTGVDVSIPASDWAALDAFAAANGLPQTTAVPEPVGLIGLAALGVLARRRRRIEN